MKEEVQRGNCRAVTSGIGLVAFEKIKDGLARAKRVWRWTDDFPNDLRFGARMLFRNPAFAALAIICLTLGIGTNAAVFVGWKEYSLGLMPPSRIKSAWSRLPERRTTPCRGLSLSR